MKPWALLHEANGALDSGADLVTTDSPYELLARDHAESVAARGLVASMGANAVASSIKELAHWESSHGALTRLPPPTDSRRIRLVTDLGNIEIALYPDAARQHVENFIKLAADGFYDGTKFHRIVRSGIHIVQGGDPNTRSGSPETWGMGGAGDGLPVEYNGLAHLRGAVAMAQPSGGTSEPKSSGCQFYIVTKPSPSLDRRYTVFGQVVSGMDVVDKISAADLAPQTERPLTSIAITHVEVL